MFNIINYNLNYKDLSIIIKLIFYYKNIYLFISQP